MPIAVLTKLLFYRLLLEFVLNSFLSFFTDSSASSSCKGCIFVCQ